MARLFAQPNLTASIKRSLSSNEPAKVVAVIPQTSMGYIHLPVSEHLIELHGTNAQSRAKPALAGDTGIAF